MKKIDLVHTTILIVAILGGYSALQFIFYALSSIASTGDLYHFRDQSSGRLLYYLIMIVLYSGTCAILVRNGRKYAHLLLKDEPEGSWEDAPRWELDRRNIILVLFIGMGLYTMVQAIPFAIDDLYELFRSKVESEMFKSASPVKTNLLVELLRTTIGALLVYAAPTLTRFIELIVAARFGSES